MWIIWLFVGSIIGFATGIVAAVMMAVESDKQAVSNGVIKLQGKIYVLNEIEV